MLNPMRHTLLLWILILAGCAGGGAGSRKQSGAGEMDLLQVRQLAEASYAAKNYTESEKHYSLLVRQAPIEAENWFRLGNIYARTNRPEQAVAFYREALVRSPDHAKAWFNMAVLQINQAANSLIEHQKHANPADPSAERSGELLKELQAMIQGGPGSEPSSEPEADAAPAN